MRYPLLREGAGRCSASGVRGQSASMTRTKSLPVVMPRVAGQRWACHACAYCCRELVVSLSAEDRERIDRGGWRERLGVEPYVRLGRKWVLNKTPDGACVFLDPENRCRLHAEFGEEAKPLDCRRYPFTFRPVGGTWRVGLRFDCPSMARSQGEPIRQSVSWLRALAPIAPPEKKMCGEDRARLPGGRRAQPEEIDVLVDRFLRWIGREDVPIRRRMIGAARMTGTLAAARFKKVRGSRFRELLDLLFGVIEREAEKDPRPPAPRQKAMLRQFVFAHAESVSFHEMRRGLGFRLARRFRQLTDARRFRQGRGIVPPLPGATGSTSFETVERVRFPKDDTLVDDLCRRYLTVRLESRTVFGSGFHGWPVVAGLGALWLTVAAAGWLARWHAACAGRDLCISHDFVAAMGRIDAAATHLPAAGSSAERLRVSYLQEDDGIARLISVYGPPG
ncbi:MAG: YkgJ family cysteine cluster protein [Planctomycetota bacterium]|nr:MAG: YkgJ family cysteine cluster protein [Planctomycetota bacterium]